MVPTGPEARVAAITNDGMMAGPAVPPIGTEKSAAQPDFASELAAAAGNAAEPATTKPKSAPKTELKSTVAEPGSRTEPVQTVTVAAVPPVAAAPETPTKDSRNPG